MDFDLVLEHMGQFGLWQRLVFVMAGLAAAGEAIVTLMFSFVGYVPDYRCLVPQCESTTDTFYDAYESFNFALPSDKDDDDDDVGCYVYGYISNANDTNGAVCDEDHFDSILVKCEKHVFDQSDYERSFAMENDLTSCQEWPLDPLVSQTAFIGMCYMFGFLIGSFVFGIFSDRYGRKITLLTSVFFTAATALIGAFMNDYWPYLAVRFLSGVSAKALFMLAFMFSVEVTGVKYKTYLGILIQVPYAMGEMLVGLLAYYIQDWQNLQITLSILIFCLSILWFILPESPRWLISRRRLQEAKVIITKGARLNKRTVPNHLLEATPGQEVEEVAEMGFRSLFAHRYTTVNTLVMMVNWTVATMAYYGLSLNSVNLSGDIYVNFVLTALIEIPSYVFCVMVMDGCGRKPILVFCQLLAGVSCIAAGLVNVDWLVTTLTLAGKFGAAAAFAILYLYTAELYPTVVRNTAVGSCSMVARVGGVVAPLLAGISPVSIPLIIMGGSALVGGVLAFLLPETLGTPLPESIEDIRHLLGASKPWYRWISRKELKALNKEALAARTKSSEEKKDIHKSEVQTETAVIPQISIQEATPPPTRNDRDQNQEDKNISNNVKVVIEFDTIANGLLPDVLKGSPENYAEAPNIIAKVSEEEEGPSLTSDHQILISPDETIAPLQKGMYIPRGSIDLQRMPTIEEQSDQSGSDHTLNSSPSSSSPSSEAGDASKSPETALNSSPSLPSPSPPPSPAALDASTSPETALNSSPSSSSSYLEVGNALKSPETALNSSPSLSSAEVGGASKSPETALNSSPSLPSPSPGALDASKSPETALNSSSSLPSPSPAALDASKSPETTAPAPLMKHLTVSLSTTSSPSRKFSQVAPAAIDSPDAVKVGAKFTMIPTRQKEETILVEGQPALKVMSKEGPSTPSSLSLPATNAPKSRKFSQIAPASMDSPDAVRLGSKFIMIPTEGQKVQT